MQSQMKVIRQERNLLDMNIINDNQAKNNATPRDKIAAAGIDFDKAAAELGFDKVAELARSLDDPFNALHNYKTGGNEILSITGARNAKEVRACAETSSAFNESMGKAVLLRLSDVKTGESLAKSVYYDMTYLRPYLVRDFILDDDHTMVAGEISEEDNLLDLLQFLQANGFERAKMPVLTAVINQLAKQTKRSQFEIYLDKCKRVGKVNEHIWTELREWLMFADEPYNYAAFRALMSAIYQQQTYKGKPEDYQRAPISFVFFGGQGVGKDDFLGGISAGQKLRMTSAAELKSKDRVLAVLGSVVIAFSDTPTQRTSTVDEFKGATDQKTLDVRLPYAVQSHRYPFRAVFVGATNRQDFYADTTGDRRDLPVILGEGMSYKEALAHGTEWHKRLFDTDGVPAERPGFFADLWATFLDEVHRKGLPPTVLTGELSDRRSELVAEHRTESVLVTSVEAVAERIFNPQTKIDPFEGTETTLPARTSVPEKEFNEAVRNELADIYGDQNTAKKKFIRSVVVEHMRQLGYKYTKKNGRQYQVK